ncbi:Methyltransferase-like protein 22 [Entophlyctis luteolus]|nr:Methyltransferase-like protein 22 [Entophlyctis luteolus]
MNSPASAPTAARSRTRVRDGVVLSDVHVRVASGAASSDGTVASNYISRVPHINFSATILHALATPIDAVGLQVWAGAMLLSEYLLSNPITVRGKIVLELGAGTGLASIAAVAAGARAVVATDIHDEGILSLLHRNVKLNNLADIVSIAPLDLMDDSCPLFSALSDLVAPQARLSPRESPEVVASAFHQFQTSGEIIIAADILYLDDVTFQLVRRLPHLLLLSDANETCGKWRSRTMYMALEKRIQFSVDELRPTAPAWDFFVRTVEAMNSDLEARITDDCEPLPADFPDVRIRMTAVDLSGTAQLFSEYERVKELELWQINLEFR